MCKTANIKTKTDKKAKQGRNPFMPINEGGPTAAVILEYAAIAVTAFLLGAAVTAFCFMLRKKRGQEEGRK